MSPISELTEKWQEDGSDRVMESRIYADHTSDLSYVYHQASTSSDETLKSKLAFEKFAATHSWSIYQTIPCW